MLSRLSGTCFELGRFTPLSPWTRTPDDDLVWRARLNQRRRAWIFGLTLTSDCGMPCLSLADVRDVVFATRPCPIWLRAGGKGPMIRLLPILEGDRLLPRPSTPRMGVLTKTAAISRRIRLGTAFQGQPASAIAASRLHGLDPMDTWYEVWTASLLCL
ncbi:hypothetical protein BDZ89DRAFT_280255 [Hymenopellis radicata]|nr:hypothetical protein BDZ89DRAFT_280255 [Hymenopellis radicata]